MNLQSNVGLVSKLLNNRDFRDAYVYEHLKTGIAFQLRAMRDEREWTQAKVGKLAGKPRNVITRIEDPNYGQFSLQTLREIASAFNVALLVKFVSFSRLLDEYDDVTPQALIAPSVNDSREVKRLKRWAAAKDRAQSEKAKQSTPAHSLRLVHNSVIGADRLFLDKPRGQAKRVDTITMSSPAYQFPQRRVNG